jgi:tyrosyl-tRNA synthetase
VIDEVSIALPAMSGVVDILAATGLAPSKSEARRLIQGGGVSIDGEKVSDVAQSADITEYRLFKVGKRKFLKIKAE